MHVISGLAATLLGVVAQSSQPQDAPLPSVPPSKEPLEKTLLVRCDAIGEITDIAFGRVDGTEHERLVLAGTRGFALLDPKSTTIERTVAFESTLPPQLANASIRCRIVDVDGDGDLEFVRLAAHWVGRTSLHDGEGKALWAHPEAKGSPQEGLVVATTSCGDVDADGKPEFLMTFNATNEVHLVDHAGKLVWAQEWSGGKLVDDALFVDVDGDGRRDIVYVDGAALWARNAKGDVLVSTELPEGGFVNHLELIHSYGEPARDWLLVGHHVKQGEHAGQNFHLVGLDAKSVGPHVSWDEVELCRETGSVRFPEIPALASFRIDTKRTLAVVAGFGPAQLRVRVLDAGHKIRFEEILSPPEGTKGFSDGAALFLDKTKDQPARLLIAYESTVFAYSARR